MAATRQAPLRELCPAQGLTRELATEHLALLETVNLRCAGPRKAALLQRGADQRDRRTAGGPHDVACVRHPAKP